MPFEDAPLQNGVFNLLFAYGWLAFPLFVLLWRATGGGINGLFMLLVMAQNGAPLDFDKLALIVFAIQIARYGRYRSAPAPMRFPARAPSPQPYRRVAVTAARRPLHLPEI